MHFSNLFSLAAIFYLSKSQQEISSVLIIFFVSIFFLYIRYTKVTLHMPINKCNQLLSALMFHQYIYQPCLWMLNNTGSVLKLQLIISNLSFIFSTNDLQMSLRVFLGGTLETTHINYDFECETRGLTYIKILIWTINLIIKGITTILLMLNIMI